MKAESKRPDSAPPGLRRLLFGAFCWLNRRPRVLRAVGWAFRTWPRSGGMLSIVARRDAVQQALLRPRSFSNGSHQGNLIAGTYLIGMDPGPVYRRDKQLLDAILADLGPTLVANADASARHLVSMLDPGREPFELIDDYLMWVVFAAIRPAFGEAATTIVGGADPASERSYLLEIRRVAGHLLGGSLTPLERRQRADVAGDALRARVRRARHALRQAWRQKVSFPMSDEDLDRNAVGLAWVSHPVTAQSGALAFQELLGRPETYDALRAEAARLGPRAWSDPPFRDRVRSTVLELMRFRPIFPLLARVSPRETEFETGARRAAICPAGGALNVMGIAASFDTRGIPDAVDFCPDRRWPDGQEDMRFMMFGYGDRRCPARHLAADMLASAFIGLLTLPELGWADRGRHRVVYDGPLIVGMRVRSVSARKA